MNMAVSFATSSHRRLYAPEVAGNTWVYIVDLHTAASTITACASPFAVAQRRGRYAAGDLIPNWDRLAAGVAVCVLRFIFFQRLVHRLDPPLVSYVLLVLFAAVLQSARQAEYRFQAASRIAQGGCGR